MRRPAQQVRRRVRRLVRRRLRGDEAPGVYGSIALLLSYPLLLVGALWPNAWLFAAAAAVSYLAEAVTARHATYLTVALRQVAIGVALRFALRELAVLILIARIGEVGAGWFAAFALAVVSLHGIRAVQSAMAIYIRRRRQLPVITRGIDLSALDVPDAPHPILFQGQVQLRAMLNLDLLPVAGAAIGAITGAYWPASWGAAVAIGLGMAAVVATVPHALRVRGLGDVDRVLAHVGERVAAMKPEVVLYFSGSLDSAYQINMWLSTVDRLDRRTLIILRDRGIVPLLGRTSVPVLCVPAGTDMMNFPVPGSVRVGLFPANTGNNIHLIRLAGIKQVFIGHGDSDKAASFNPFSKVYDQVWVAGPAGRDRYLRARVGVRDDEIVEVGRPQLAPIHVGRQTPDPMLTVLYAPTWEGWTGDPFHTSLALMGPTIVAALLDHLPHVRLLYKPHPLTGKDDLRVRDAHDRILAMIQRANRSREASGEWTDPATRAAAERAGRRLGGLTERLAELTDPDAARAGRGAGAGAARARPGRIAYALGVRPDEAQLSRDSATPDPTGEAVWQATLDAWHEAFWAAEPWWRHRVITGPHPHIYQCFNRCDLLITDISSVAADFIASGKPYAVTNPGDVDAERFRSDNPTAAAAYLLGRACAELPDILTEVEKDGPDRMAGRRRELKTYLLGPDEPDAVTRFTAALDALVDRPARDRPAAGNGNHGRPAAENDARDRAVTEYEGHGRNAR
jgi:hypothetical protein